MDKQKIMNKQFVFSGKAYAKHSVFWTNELKNIKPFIFRGDVNVLEEPKRAMKQFTLSSKAKALLEQYAGVRPMENFTLWLTAITSVLSRYADRAVVTVNTPLFAMESTEDQYETRLPICLTLQNEESIKQNIIEIGNRLKAFYEYQNFPLDILDLPDKDMLQSPFSNIWISLDDFHAPLGEEASSQAAIYFKINKAGSFNIDYDSSIFSDILVEQLARHIQLILEQYENLELRNDQLSILTTEDFEQVVLTFNETAQDLNAESILSVFKNTIQTYPDQKALTFKDRQYTYRELDEITSRLAACLQSVKNIGKAEVVGVHLDKSDYWIISMLAILKSGGSYVPVPTDKATARKKHIIRASEVKLLISLEGQTVEGLDHLYIDQFVEGIYGEDQTLIDIEIKAEDIAYTLFTSGSTGNPKGVSIDHIGLLNVVLYHVEELNISPKDCYLQFMSSTFDGCLVDVFATLLGGGHLLLPTPEIISSPTLFKTFLDENEVTMTMLTPSYIATLNKYLPKSLRVLISAGEVAKIEDARFYSQHLDLYNGYGPTETAIITTLYPIENGMDYKTIPVGAPCWNKKIYILDDQLRPMPMGAYGEICIAGLGVAKEYVNDPAMTEGRFIANPFVEGEIMYRSGDIGFWLPDGNIEYIGRKDDQVKIRGFRVEIKEIENVLSQYAEVDQAIILYDTLYEGDKELIGIFTKPNAAIEGLQKLGNADFGEWIDGKLPYYMQPVLNFELTDLPKNQNGKADKKVLLQMVREFLKTENKTEAAQNKTEEILIQLVAEVLSKPASTLGRNANFFGAGGHSLAANQLINEIYKKFQLTLSIADIFKNSDLCDLAEVIANKKPETYEAIPLASPDIDRLYPVSAAQKQIWFAEQQQADSIAFNVPSYLRLKGNLDVDVFKKVLDSLVQRHESLRTVFRIKNGSPFQMIPDFENCKIAIEVKDLRGKEDRQKLIGRLAIQEMQSSFDLENGPLLTMKLYRLEEEEHVFLMTMHHLVTDGTSMRILLNELIEGYNTLLAQNDLEFKTLKSQYKDYASWQLKNRYKAEDKSYWLKQFEGDIPKLELIYDFPKPKVRSQKGKEIGFLIDEKQTQKLLEFCHREQWSLYMVCSSIIYFLLSKYSNQKDIVIGSPVAGRKHSDLENMIGCFVNMLALRNQILPEDTFRTLCERVKEITLEGYEHQAYSFNDLVKSLQLSRATAGVALYDVFLDVQMEGNFPKLKDLEIEELAVDFCKSNFDLQFFFKQLDTTIEGNIIYDQDLFTQGRIEEMGQHFVKILNQLIDDETAFLQTKIGDINYLPEKEKQKLINDFNQTQEDYPSTITISEAFEQQVLTQPEAIAVVARNVEYSYASLNGKANRLAYHLQKVLGVNTGDIVAVYCENNIDFIVSILSVLKAGATYVPFDVETSSNTRFQTIIVDHNIKTILSQSNLAKDLDFFDGQVFNMDTEFSKLVTPRENPTPDINAQDLAYVIFTSGSTGKPKGVMIEHRNLMNMISNTHTIDPEDGKRVLLTGSLSFDASTFDIWRTLAKGNTLYLFPKTQLKEVGVLQKEIVKHQIDFIFLTTPWFNYLIDNEPMAFENLRTVVTGGDMVSARHINKLRLQFPWLKIVHGYGPAENTTYSTSFNVEKTCPNTVPIGTPWNNQQVYLLDEFLKPVPVGVTGEMCIAGDSLARGYLNAPDLTAEKFVDNPFAPGKKMYRTGDLAYYLPDGNIVFKGREDKQLKINGYRVEIFEIMDTLKKHPLLKDAYVFPFKSEDNENTLRCLLNPDMEDRKIVQTFLDAGLEMPKAGTSVPISNEAFIQEIREYAYEHLPGYMVPKAFILLNEFPLSVNGKVDVRKANEFFNSYQSTTTIIPASSIQEKLLVKIWQEVLRKEQIGILDNYYELGGDSVKAMQISAKLHKAGFKIEVKDIFTFQNIKGIAAQMEKVKRIADQSPVTGKVKLNAIQSEFFEWELKVPNHFNQAVLFHCPDKISTAELNRLLSKIQEQHDMLRAHFIVENGSVEQICRPTDLPVALDYYDLSQKADANLEIEKIAEKTQGSLDLSHKLWAAAHIQLESSSRLLIVIHHLVIDTVSWRILIDDLRMLFTQLSDNKPLELDLKTDSFRTWTDQLAVYANSESLLDQYDYWLEKVSSTEYSRIPRDMEAAQNDLQYTLEEKVELTKTQTGQLLSEAYKAFKAEINDVLLLALGMALHRTFSKTSQQITLEGHGREKIAEDLDISRTIGWFTSVFPVLLEYDPEKDIEENLLALGKNLREIPSKGMTFGVLKYLSKASKERQLPAIDSQISFNYLGQFDHTPDQNVFALANESTGTAINKANKKHYDLEFGGIVYEDRLRMTLSYSPLHFHTATAIYLMEQYQQAIMECIKACIQKNQKAKTADDFTSKGITTANLNKLNELFQ